jgi:hypothetical protein
MAWWVQISSTGYCLWIAFTNHVLLTRHHYSFHDFQVGAVVVLCWLVCQLKVTNYRLVLANYSHVWSIR